MSVPGKKEDLERDGGFSERLWEFGLRHASVGKLRDRKIRLAVTLSGSYAIGHSLTT